MPHMQEFKNVDDYIAAQPEDVQTKLEQLRQTIRKAAPKADEGISYGMPSYKLHGPLVYFGAAKTHIGFYPTADGIEAFKNELSDYDFSKGTIRLPNDKPLPVRLIRDIVKFRIARNEEKASLTTKKAKV